MLCRFKAKHCEILHFGPAVCAIYHHTKRSYNSIYLLYGVKRLDLNFLVKCFFKYWFIVIKLGTARNVQSLNSISIMLSAGQHLYFISWML